ncbi:MAG TPA: Lrp/AsnC family transcriptional regulator [Trebonia sp.]|nr:Lrp/AsnC family transcriptional regulator [Trebonia sp.]
MKSAPRRPAIDDLDRKILAALQLDPRASWSKVGELVGTSETTALRRLHRMRAQGDVIVTGQGDPLRCGFGKPVLLYFSAAPDKKQTLAAQLASRPDVQYVSLVTGRHDVMCELISPSHEYLADVVMNQLPRSGLFESSATAIVLKRFKTQDQWSRGLLDGVTDFSAYDENLSDDPADAPPLDALDRAILAALVADGRRPHSEVAAEVGVGEAVVGRRVQALVAGKRLSFVAMIAPATLGFEVEAMLHIRTQLGNLDATARAVAAMPEARYVAATTGDADLVALAVLRDTAEAYAFLTERLGSLPGIRSVETDIVLESVKRGYHYPLFSSRTTADGEDRLSPQPVGPAALGSS